MKTIKSPNRAPSRPAARGGFRLSATATTLAAVVVLGLVVGQTDLELRYSPVSGGFDAGSGLLKLPSRLPPQ